MQIKVLPRRFATGDDPVVKRQGERQHMGEAYRLCLRNGLQRNAPRSGDCDLRRQDR